MNKYYIYFHINPLTNKPFYIGKGEGFRARRKSQRSKEWNDVVSKYGYVIDIVEDNLTEVEAMNRERFYINWFGRLNNETGILINKTGGGSGSSGAVVTDETRLKIRETLKRKYKSGEIVPNYKPKVDKPFIGSGMNQKYKGTFRLPQNIIEEISKISYFKDACDKFNICPATYYKIRRKYNEI